MSHNTEMNWHWIKCYELAVGLHTEFTATYVSFLTVREKFSNNKAKRQYVTKFCHLKLQNEAIWEFKKTKIFINAKVHHQSTAVYRSSRNSWHQLSWKMWLQIFGVLSKWSNEQHAEHIHTHSCIEIISINNQQPVTNYNTIHKYLSAKHMFYHWTTKQYKTDILLLVSSTTWQQKDYHKHRKWKPPKISRG